MHNAMNTRKNQDAISGTTGYPLLFFICAGLLIKIALPLPLELSIISCPAKFNAFIEIPFYKIIKNE